MERNVCGLDRTVRLAVGTALAALTLRSIRARRTADDPGSIAPRQILAAYAAAELLLTGLVQWCPGNYLCGVNTCEQGWRSAMRDVRRQLPVPW